MTGSTLNLILISVVVVTVLAIWIVLVFYADAHPAWRRREASARHGTAGQAARPPAGQPCADQAEMDYHWSRLSEGGLEVARCRRRTSTACHGKSSRACLPT